MASRDVIDTVTAVSVDGGVRNWTFVLVTTEQGLQGLGEATLEFNYRQVEAAIGELGRKIRGRSIDDVTAIWRSMHRGAFYRGGPATMSAISGIDTALWDLKAQRADVPLYQLFGGACREWLPVYANSVRGEAPDTCAQSALALVGLGHNSLKMGFVDPMSAVDGLTEVRRAVDRVAAVREAVGPDVRICVDLHGRSSATMSIQFARLAEPLGLWWLEEPAPPESWQDTARVARATSIPVAAGERCLTRWGVRDLIAGEAVALIQPDNAHAGGISEMRAIAAMAEAFGVGFAPHNPLSPVNTMATAHLGIATPGFVALEWVWDDPPQRDRLTVEPVAPVGSTFTVPDRPGLGVTLDLEECAAHPPVEHDMPQLRHPDGSFADW